MNIDSTVCVGTRLFFSTIQLIFSFIVSRLAAHGRLRLSKDGAEEEENVRRGFGNEVSF